MADAWRAFWISRVVVWACGVGAVLVWGLEDDNALKFDSEGLTRPFGGAGDDLVAPGARWDAVWFLRIAEDGYAPDDARAAFFPLYPLLVRVLGVLGSPLVAGLAVSLAALLGALVVLHRLVALDFGRDVARLSVLLVAVFPGALWFSSVYSEALFLLLSVAAVYFARVDRWALAGVAGALAAGTRSAGVVLLVPLALLWWRGGRRPGDLAWVLLVPAGVAAFCAYIALATDFPATTPFDAQEAWRRELAGPYAGIGHAVEAAWNGARDVLTGAERPDRPFDPARLNVELFACLVLALVAAAGALRRLPLAYGLYPVAALALPLSYPVDGQPLMSLWRFVAVLWPLHLWLALVLAGRPRATRIVVAVSLVALGLFSARVARWGWVA